MTEALLLRGDEKVLEVGTGSGYQAAVLSALAREVVTVERFPSLAEQAAAVLAELGRANVRVYVAGPTLGWPDEAPYDAIIVTAGAPSVPEALVAQLAPGGRLVLPVGSRYEQELTRVTLLADDSLHTERLGPCRFVPLVGEGAWPNDDHPDLV
ncbi:MAG: protein-L-isoaspartate O-methyltransferase [Dehalococcoidia bacterium]